VVCVQPRHALRGLRTCHASIRPRHITSSSRQWPL